MSRIRGKDTAPEMLVRRALWRLGHRYRLHVRGLPGRPDIVLPKHRLVVFVNGCYWHRHGCSRTTVPKSNRAFWEAKFAANIARDLRNEASLVADGWRVEIIWECGTSPPDVLAARLAVILPSR